MYSLHPGVITTNLGRSWPWWLRTSFQVVGPLMFPKKTVPQGAATTVYAALSPDLEGKCVHQVYA